MLTESEILSELKRRKAAGQLRPDDPFLKGDTSPLSEQAIVAAETRLGFGVPKLLRAIYGEVSNGGFGDSYGFLGLIGGLSICRSGWMALTSALNSARDHNNERDADSSTICN